MLLSSCVVWRHADWDDFRRECPGGDERLQRLVWERLDDAIEWLERAARPSCGRRPATRGRAASASTRTGSSRRSRRDGGGELDAAGGGRRAADPLHRRLRRLGGARRTVRGARRAAAAAGESLVDGRRPRARARQRGAALTGGLDEFYGRNMPDAPWDEDELVLAARSSTGASRGSSTATASSSSRAADVSWSETNVVQATARRPGAIAYYVLDEEALHERCATARLPRWSTPLLPRRGCRSRSLPFAPPAGSVAAVRVVASITHTIGGLVVDEHARVLRADGTPIDGLWAAGVDAGGVATGGYASGLAQALVQGLGRGEIAAELREVSDTFRRRHLKVAPLALADREGAGAVVARQGRGADLVHDEHVPVVVELVADAAAGRPPARAACSPPATRRRARTTRRQLRSSAPGRVRRQRHRDAGAARPRADLDRAVQLLDALLDRLERAAPALGLGVVPDRPSRARRRRARACSPRSASAARGGSPARAARGSPCRGQPARSRRRAPRRRSRGRCGSRSRCRSGRRARAAPARSPGRAGRPARARTRGRAAPGSSCAAARERGLEHLLRVVELAGRDRVERGVEHQRDARQVLHGPVVEEERDPAAFVLLGRDQTGRARHPRSIDDRLAQRDRDRVRPCVGLELREDVPDVALHRLLRDEEPLRRRRRSTCRRRAAGGSPARAPSACRSGPCRRGTPASAPGRRSRRRCAIFSIARTSVWCGASLRM